MILDQFRAWAQTASPATRADGARALARAYLHARSNERQRHDAAAVLTSFLDDPSLLVRTSLAEALAESAGAPHHIILALADDVPAIAAIVLAASPLLSDAELVDCATTSGAEAQSAIAARANLAAPVAATLAEVGVADALVALAGNRTAALGESVIRRMVERFADHADLREALLARPGLPVAIRVDLVAAAMRALACVVAERMPDERLKRIGREAKHRAVIAIADASRGSSGALELVKALRQSGDLTSSLLFRAILSGRLELFKAALGELAGVPVERVDHLTQRSDGGAFANLARKAGLPAALLPAIRIALAAARDTDWCMMRTAGLSSLMIERVLTGCDAINTGELDTLMVLLRRFEAEAAREATRPTSGIGTWQSAALPERERAVVAPLLLKEREHASPDLRLVPARREPRVLFIDLAAIEAELCAA